MANSNQLAADFAVACTKAELEALAVLYLDRLWADVVKKMDQHRLEINLEMSAEYSLREATLAHERWLAVSAAFSAIGLN